MNDLIELVKSLEEPNMWYTAINVFIVALALFGIIVLTRSYLESRKGK